MQIWHCSKNSRHSVKSAYWLAVKLEAWLFRDFINACSSLWKLLWVSQIRGVSLECNRIKQKIFFPAETVSHALWECKMQRRNAIVFKSSLCDAVVQGKEALYADFVPDQRKFHFA